jgi:uncharacterized protein (TIGR02594 family)
MPTHLALSNRFRALVALPAGAAMLLLSAASAQAMWSPAAPNAKDYHCSAPIRAQHTPPLSIQSCIGVHDSPSGAYVQGAVKVTSLDDNPRRLVRPSGYTRVWLDGKIYRDDNCGPTTLAGGQSRWCYGKTTLILGHNRDVSATGYTWSGNGTHDAVKSPHWKISRRTPIQDARARIVSILRAEAANPSHNHEIGGADCNFYSGALRAGALGGCYAGFRHEPWCADFGRWVWRQAGVRTTYLNARAASFETYGKRLHTWHGGRSLSGIQPGDALVFTRSGGGHVAFVTSVNRNGSVSAIAGNSGDKVTSSVYRPGHSRLVGFAAPVM